MSAQSFCEGRVFIEDDFVRRSLTPACAFKMRPHLQSVRNHQGKGNVILFSAVADPIGELSGEIRIRRRLGGLLNFITETPHEVFVPPNSAHYSLETLDRVMKMH